MAHTLPQLKHLYEGCKVFSGEGSSGHHEHCGDPSTESSRRHDNVITTENDESQEGYIVIDSYNIARDIFHGVVTKTNLYSRSV